MDLLWLLLLPAMAVAIVLSQNGRMPGRFPRGIPSAPVSKGALSRGERTACRVPPGSARPVRSIRADALPALLDRSGRVTVFDFRRSRNRLLFPVPGVLVTRLDPAQLAEVLQWLPGNQSAIFWGASGVLLEMIETAQCAGGNAPLYVIEEESAEAKVA